LEISLDSDFVRVTDCVNGSFINMSKFGNYTNLTQINRIHQEEGIKNPFDKNKLTTKEPRKKLPTV